MASPDARGVSEYRHGLTLTTVHMESCCDRWAQSREPEAVEPEAEAG